MNFKILGAVYIGISLGLLIFSLLVAQDLFTSNFKAYIVMSGSMEPVIPTGSIILTRSHNSYSIGQIITFKANNSIITHRIHSIEDTANPENKVYQTKGDANEEADFQKINQSHIIGTSILTIPYLGFLANFAKTPKGFVALIIIPASIIIYEELKNILREVKKFLPKHSPSLLSPKFTNFSLIIFTGSVGIFLLVSLATSKAFFFDNELSNDNLLGIATSFQDATPTGQIVINEVLYNPSSNQMLGGNPDENNFEWIELYNTEQFAVNIKNWSIIDNSANPRTISTSNRIIPPGEFVVIAKAANVKAVWGIPPHQFIAIGENFGNGLANGGDQVILKNSNGEIIDQISYGTDTFILNPAIPAAAEGNSIERSPKGTDTNQAIDFIEQSPPTPGS